MRLGEVVWVLVDILWSSHRIRGFEKLFQCIPLRLTRMLFFTWYRVQHYQNKFRSYKLDHPHLNSCGNSECSDEDDQDLREVRVVVVVVIVIYC